MSYAEAGPGALTVSHSRSGHKVFGEGTAPGSYAEAGPGALTVSYSGSGHDVFGEGTAPVSYAEAGPGAFTVSYSGSGHKVFGEGTAPGSCAEAGPGALTVLYSGGRHKVFGEGTAPVSYAEAGPGAFTVLYSGGRHKVFGEGTAPGSCAEAGPGALTVLYSGGRHDVFGEGTAPVSYAEAGPGAFTVLYSGSRHKVFGEGTAPGSCAEAGPGALTVSYSGSGHNVFGEGTAPGSYAEAGPGALTVSYSGSGHNVIGEGAAPVGCAEAGPGALALVPYSRSRHNVFGEGAAPRRYAETGPREPTLVSYTRRGHSQSKTNRTLGAGSETASTRGPGMNTTMAHEQEYTKRWRAMLELEILRDMPGLGTHMATGILPSLACQKLEPTIWLFPQPKLVGCAGTNETERYQEEITQQVRGPNRASDRWRLSPPARWHKKQEKKREKARKTKSGGRTKEERAPEDEQSTSKPRSSCKQQPHEMRGGGASCPVCEWSGTENGLLAHIDGKHKGQLGQDQWADCGMKACGHCGRAMKGTASMHPRCRKLSSSREVEGEATPSTSIELQREFPRVSVTKTKGDGDCMFRAILLAKGEWNRRVGARVLRKRLAEYMRGEERTDQWFVNGLAKEDYAVRLENKGWGDNVALQVAADQMGVVIIVWEAGRLLKMLPLRRTEDIPLWIVLDKEHYEAVLQADAEMLNRVEERAEAVYVLKLSEQTAEEAAVRIGLGTGPSAGLRGSGPYYCPRGECSRSRAQRFEGYKNWGGLLGHLNKEHLLSDRPLTEAEQQAMGVRPCTMCGCLTGSSTGVHPRCREAMALDGGEEEVQNAPWPDEKELGELPSWEEIGAAQVVVPKKLDERLTMLWARALMATLQRIAQRNDPRAWKLLLMLPKACLGTPAVRKDEKGTETHRERLTSRLEGWLRGEYVAMWSTRAKRNKRRREKETTQGERYERCCALSRRGRYAQANKCLVSSGLAPNAPEVLAAMQTIHPSPMHEKIDLEGVRTGNTVVSPEEALASLKTFPKDTGAGPSGLSVELLKQACDTGLRGLMPTLCTTLELLVRGKVPYEAAPVLAGARLIALKKEPTGYRPIAVGESLRRWAWKIVLAKIRPKIPNLLKPGGQLGVAVPSGVEAVYAIVRDYAKRNRGANKAILTIDFENAFNCVSRAVFLRELASTLPELLPLASWCYERPTSLFFEDTTIPSREGAQQGDPAGPLLFSLGIKSLLEGLKKMGLDGSLWFLDDGVLMGGVDELAKAYDYLVQKASSLGLKVKEAKCVFVPLRVGLEPKGGLEKVKQESEGNFTILKLPVGSGSYCKEYLLQYVTKLKKVSESLTMLPDRHVALTQLRYCHSYGKMVYLMRSMYLEDQRSGLADFDAVVRSVLRGLVGGDMDERAHLQAELPLREGGVGLRNCGRHAAAGRAASATATRKLCVELDAQYQVDPEEWSGVCKALTLETSEECDLDLDKVVRQRELSMKIDASLKTKMVNDLKGSGDRERLAHFRAVSMPRASAWLAEASDTGTVMPSQIFRTAIRAHLGLEVLQAGQLCKRCNAKLDPRGVHAGMCNRGATPTIRHNLVRDFLAKQARVTGMSVEMEPQRILDGGRKPADILVSEAVPGTTRNWTGRPAAYDVTVIEVCSQTSLSRGSHLDARRVIQAKEREKVKKYGEECSSKGIAFVPLVFTRDGAMNEAAAAFIKAISLRTRRPAEAWRALSKEISTTLAYSWARAVEDRGELLMGGDGAPISTDLPPIFKEDEWEDEIQDLVDKMGSIGEGPDESGRLLSEADRSVGRTTRPDAAPEIGQAARDSTQKAGNQREVQAPESGTRSTLQEPKELEQTHGGAGEPGEARTEEPSTEESGVGGRTPAEGPTPDRGNAITEPSRAEEPGPTTKETGRLPGAPVVKLVVSEGKPGSVPRFKGHGRDVMAQLERDMADLDITKRPLLSYEASGKQDDKWATSDVRGFENTRGTCYAAATVCSLIWATPLIGLMREKETADKTCVGGCLACVLWKMSKEDHPRLDGLMEETRVTIQDFTADTVRKEITRYSLAGGSPLAFLKQILNNLALRECAVWGGTLRSLFESRLKATHRCVCGFVRQEVQLSFMVLDPKTKPETAKIILLGGPLEEETKSPTICERCRSPNRDCTVQWRFAEMPPILFAKERVEQTTRAAFQVETESGPRSYVLTGSVCGNGRHAMTMVRTPRNRWACVSDERVRSKEGPGTGPLYWVYTRIEGTEGLLSEKLLSIDHRMRTSRALKPRPMDDKSGRARRWYFDQKTQVAKEAVVERREEPVLHVEKPRAEQPPSPSEPKPLEPASNGDIAKLTQETKEEPPVQTNRSKGDGGQQALPPPQLLKSEARSPERAEGSTTEPMRMDGSDQTKDVTEPSAGIGLHAGGNYSDTSLSLSEPPPVKPHGNVETLEPASNGDIAKLTQETKEAPPVQTNRSEGDGGQQAPPPPQLLKSEARSPERAEGSTTEPMRMDGSDQTKDVTEPSAGIGSHAGGNYSDTSLSLSEPPPVKPHENVERMPQGLSAVPLTLSKQPEDQDRRQTPPAPQQSVLKLQETGQDLLQVPVKVAERSKEPEAPPAVKEESNLPARNLSPPVSISTPSQDVRTPTQPLRDPEQGEPHALVKPTEGAQTQANGLVSEGAAPQKSRREPTEPKTSREQGLKLGFYATGPTTWETAPWEGEQDPEEAQQKREPLVPQEANAREEDREGYDEPTARGTDGEADVQMENYESQEGANSQELMEEVTGEIAETSEPLAYGMDEGGDILMEDCEPESNLFCTRVAPAAPCLGSRGPDVTEPQSQGGGTNIQTRTTWMEGLTNLGDSCYLNATLQALLKGSHVDFQRARNTPHVCGTRCTVCALALVQGGGSQGEITRITREWMGRGQQDAHGALLHIVSDLQERARPGDLLANAFTCMVAVERTCICCGGGSQSIELDCGLILRGWDLQSALESTTIPQDYVCGLCGTGSLQERRILMEAPETMIVCIVNENATKMALGEQVSMRNSKIQADYRVSAVVVHQGCLGSGHYTSFTLSPGGWRYQDDEVERATSWREVLSSVPYVLFLRRQATKEMFCANEVPMMPRLAPQVVRVTPPEQHGMEGRDYRQVNSEMLIRPGTQKSRTQCEVPQSTRTQNPPNLLRTVKTLGRCEKKNATRVTIRAHTTKGQRSQPATRMESKFKLYAISKGRGRTTIVNSWAEAEKQTKGLSCAVYQGFNNGEEAEAFLRSTDPEYKTADKPVKGPRRNRRYAVPCGRRPGTYSTWSEASLQVLRCPGGKVKKLCTDRRAREYVEEHRATKGLTQPTPPHPAVYLFLGKTGRACLVRSGGGPVMKKWHETTGEEKDPMLAALELALEWVTGKGLLEGPVEVQAYAPLEQWTRERWEKFGAISSVVRARGLVLRLADLPVEVKHTAYQWVCQVMTGETEVEQKPKPAEPVEEPKEGSADPHHGREPRIGWRPSAIHEPEEGVRGQSEPEAAFRDSKKRAKIELIEWHSEKPIYELFYAATQRETRTCVVSGGEVIHMWRFPLKECSPNREGKALGIGMAQLLSYGDAVKEIVAYGSLEHSVESHRRYIEVSQRMAHRLGSTLRLERLPPEASEEAYRWVRGEEKVGRRLLKWKEENGKEVSQAVTSTHEKNIVPETTTEPTMDHDSDKMTSDSSSICSPPTQEDRPPVGMCGCGKEIPQAAIKNPVKHPTKGWCDRCGERIAKGTRVVMCVKCDYAECCGLLERSRRGKEKRKRKSRGSRSKNDAM